MKTYLPSPETLRKLLDYNPETGGLTWNPRTPDLFNGGKNDPEHVCARWNSRLAGKPAFTAGNGHGYFRGAIFNRKFSAARVIWAMETGAWPTGQIDHINGIRTDNRIKNLRDVSHAENMRNHARQKRNSSGVTGVHFNKAQGKWVASIHANGKSLHLGYFTSKSDATVARRSAEREHGFHENHGRTQEANT